MKRYRKTLLAALLLLPCLLAAGLLGGERKLYRYRDFQHSSECKDCHLDIHSEWERSAMAKAYTLPWDQEEYFKLALPHTKIDPKVAGVKEGCIRCHSPVAYWAGDIPPERAEKNTPANQGVSCDLCYVIMGLKGGEPHDGFFDVTPGRTKQGIRPFAKSDYHSIQLSPIIRKAEFCAACHDEMSSYGAWVKETFDNRLKPKESRIETYRWRVPEDLASGDFTIRATLSYRRLPQSVADLVGIGEIPVFPVSTDSVTWTVAKLSRSESAGKIK